MDEPRASVPVVSCCGAECAVVGEAGVIAQAGELGAGVSSGGTPWLGGAVLAAGVLVLTLTMLRRLWRRRKLGGESATERLQRFAGGEVEDSDEGSRKATSARAHAGGRSVSGLTDEVMVSAERQLREAAAKIDNRVRALEVVIRQADDRLAALNRAGVPSGSRVESASEVGGTQAANVRVRAIEPEAARAVEPLTVVAARVYALADEGRDAREIAREVGEGVGAVELMLALRRSA